MASGGIAHGMAMGSDVRFYSWKYFERVRAVRYGHRRVKSRLRACFFYFGWVVWNDVWLSKKWQKAVVRAVCGVKRGLD
jgi:hypothetical protein